MIYVFNKNKIFSCVLACAFVLMLFTFHDNLIHNNDVELVKVSSNVITSNEDNINNVTNEKDEWY